MGKKWFMVQKEMQIDSEMIPGIFAHEAFSNTNVGITAGMDIVKCDLLLVILTNRGTTVNILFLV